MEVNFSNNVHRNLLKLLGHVTIIHMHLPLKQLGKWMYDFQDMPKIIFCSVYFLLRVAK